MNEHPDIQLIMPINDKRIALCVFLYNPDTDKLNLQTIGEEQEVYAILDKFFPGFINRIKSENKEYFR